MAVKFPQVPLFETATVTSDTTVVLARERLSSIELLVCLGEEFSVIDTNYQRSRVSCSIHSVSLNVLQIAVPTKYHRNIMDEFSRARVELSVLEDKARRLFKELLDVRAAIVTQRAKIDELVRTRPAAINRLPTEILVFILDLNNDACRYFPKQKQELAGVCRRWRDVVLSSPSFWATIHVRPKSDASFIMTHIERSRGALLDIVIDATPWARSTHLAIVPSLDIVASCVHRWRSLLIGNHYYDDDDDEELYSTTPLAEFIIERIDHLQFPSLKRVEILTYSSAALDFISASRAPSLEHLELQEFVPDAIDFPPTTLKSLKLDFYDAPADNSLYLCLIPTQLTELSLSGFPKALFLPPSSIHLPLLKTLEINFYVKSARGFLNAIVAPNLERFKYDSSSDDPPSAALDELGTKFNNVRHLHFHWYSEDSHSFKSADLTALCKVFPSIRHVELSGTKQLPYLFDPTPNQPNPRVRCPIDLWTELESMAFQGLHPNWLEPNQLLAWLANRQALGLRRLHVKIYSSRSDHSRYRTFNFPWLYEMLKQTCILELDGFPLPLPEMHLYMPVDSSLRMVGAM